MRTILLGFTLSLIASTVAAQSMLDVRDGTGIPPEVETIYLKGADYLADTQKEDGSWGEGANFHGNEKNGVCGLCIMAFLSTGEDPNFGKYAVNIRRSLRHIIRDQNAKTGYIDGNM